MRALGERRQQLVTSQARRARPRARARARDHGAAAAAGVRPARSGSRRPSAIASSSAGHADHEELVEVRRGDRGELDALEQRRGGIGRLFEHALVEREPGQLAVDEACRRRACQRS